MDEETGAAIDFLWQALNATWELLDSYRRMVSLVQDQGRRTGERSEVEWKTAARSRERLGFELDALEAEVNLLKAAYDDLRTRYDQQTRHPRRRTHPNDRGD